VTATRGAVQLIVYADRVGGSLPALSRVLDGPLAGLFGGVHVLPFYERYDGIDAGFDPIDHLQVDRRLGRWDDIRRLGRSVDLVADLIVNHVSDRSAPFRDTVARGADSSYAGMFLTYGSVFRTGATERDLLRIVRPRPGLPFTPVTFGRQPRMVWTTFGPHQIDLDVREPAARRYLSAVLRRLATAGVTTVRLDAVGYAVKTAGSACFLTPDTVAFVDDIVAEARSLGLRTLAELHAPAADTASLSSHVDLVYDFALAPLILHAVSTGHGEPLSRWLHQRPDNCVTVLDTHDGIGLVDAGPGPTAPGLLSAAQVEALVATIAKNSGDTGRASRTRGGGFYQVSCTAYDAIGRDDRQYLLARLLQLFVPGVPQIYYVGLLAGHNDTARVGPGDDPRELNRRFYTEAEVADALRRPVVRELCRLIRLRGTHPAFRGTFEVRDTTADALSLSWRAGNARADLAVDLRNGRYRLDATADDEHRSISKDP